MCAIAVCADITCLHKRLQVIEKELAWQRIHHINEEQALIPEGETLVWMCAAACVLTCAHVTCMHACR